MSNSGKDIILDDAAFSKAVSDFSQVASDVQQLREDILSALEQLSKGFDTPAGAKFINSCDKNLLRQLDKQQDVVNHLCETLNDVTTEYSNVFAEYEDLNAHIRAYKQ